jgi:hypothetical protein
VIILGIDRRGADRATDLPAWICARHRGRRGWRSLSDATGLRPWSPAAAPACRQSLATTSIACDDLNLQLI